MDTTDTGGRENSKRFIKKLPKALRKYENADFELQLRARFVYYLIFSILASLAFIMFYTSYLNYTSSLYANGFFLSTFLPQIIAVGVILLALTFLLKGHYVTAVHILLNTVLSTIWFVTWIRDDDVLARLDTMFLLIAALTILPLVIKERIWVLHLYIASNIGMLLLFFAVQGHQFDLPASSIIEFICDVSIAFIFLGIVSTSIYNINRQTQLKAVSDFNEKLKAERGQIESERKFHALMESMNEVIIVSDNDHIVEYVNKKFTEKLGYTPEEVIGRQGYKMFHDEDDLKAVEKANEDRLNDKSTVYELPFKTKEGQKIVFLVSGAPFKNFKGEIIGSVGALTDITERDKADKELKESRQQFKTLAEMSPVGIFRTRADGYTSYVNPRWSEISGLSFNEALGDGWLKAVHPDDKISSLNTWYDRVEKKLKSVSEYRFIKPDGSISWVLGNAVPEMVDGEVRGYIGTITDITEAKVAQNELEKYRNHLEKLVHDRTHELSEANHMLKTSNEELEKQGKELLTAYNNLQEAQQKLIQSEKMASLGVLAAGVAHEINNPLNFISGGAYALDDLIKTHMKDYRNEVAPLIEGIHVGVKRAAEIVTSLNLYSRRDDLPATECNVHAIIDNCLVMLSNELKYRIEVKKNYTEKNVPVLGNEGRLHQVFLNVLTNAIHAIEDKGIIHIFTQAKEKRCVVSISDNGCGISSDLINRITDPFFTTKDPGKGTGLGLSITYNILKDYGGTIDFESEQGDGTTVTIKLPLIIKEKHE